MDFFLATPAVNGEWTNSPLNKLVLATLSYLAASHIVRVGGHQVSDLEVPTIITGSLGSIVNNL